MLTREEMFNQLMQETEEKMKEMLEKQASRVVCEYLPYVESDAEMNVELRARDVIEAIISEDTDTLSRFNVLNYSHNGEKMREAIYKQFRDELQTQQVKDLESKIERLQEQLNYYANRL